MAVSHGRKRLAPAGRHRKAISALLIAIALISPAIAVSAPRGSLKLSPATLRPGARIRLTGTAGGGCRAGAQVILVSAAFAGVVRHYLGGKPAVWATVRAGGFFSATITVAGGQPAGRYVVFAFCRRTAFASALLRVS
jgi:hypothetical protein